MATKINRCGSSSATLINQSLPSPQYMHDPTGRTLLEKYKVLHKLDVQSGEANLYLCNCEGSDDPAVAKIYKRRNSIKQDVLRTLLSLKSQFIAPVLACGEYEGCTVTVMPYFKNGSLKGHRFDSETLKRMVIPCVGNGLHYLHKSGIFHRDLKPSNLMFSDDRSRVLITDFGISSLTRQNQSVIVTSTGLSPEYAAPETFSSIFLKESDYYSLGITLYELYTGHTPFSSGEFSEQELVSMASIGSIPFPEDFPSDLETLIKGLTYKDLTYRNSPDNPNRRWSWTELKRWCRNEYLPIPGENAGSRIHVSASGLQNSASVKDADTSREISLPETGAFRMPVVIMGADGNQHQAADLKALVNLLVSEWEAGKKIVEGKILSEHLRNNNCLAAAGLVVNFENMQVDDENYSALLTALQLFYGGSDFFWKGRRYPSTLYGLSADLTEKFFPAAEGFSATVKSAENKNISEKKYIRDLFNAVIAYLEIFKRKDEAEILKEFLHTADYSRYDAKTMILALASFADPALPIILRKQRFSDIQEFARSIECLRKDDALFCMFINENAECVLRYSRCLNSEISAFMKRTYSEWHEFVISHEQNLWKTGNLKRTVKQPALNPVLHSADDITTEITAGIIENRLQSLTVDYEFTRSRDWDNESDEEYEQYRNLFSPFCRADRISPLTRIDFPIILTSKVTSLASAFLGFEMLESVNIRDTSGVSSMSEMFCCAVKFNGDIESWDTSAVTEMDGMFSGATSFNGDIGKWNTGKVRTMNAMFWNAVSFNRYIGDWDTQSVTDMRGMFLGAAKFNSPLEKWVTSAVTDMSWMFSDASCFNQPIGGWDTSSVTDMSGMFKKALSFNHDLKNWDVSKVRSFRDMFAGARAFTQSIGLWKIDEEADTTGMISIK